MRITDRVAGQRIRQAADAEEAGGQHAFLRANGLPEKRWQTPISNACVLKGPIRAEILALVGLRRDEHGDIHAPDRPARISFVAVHAEGEAAVDAAIALITATLGRAS